MNHVSEYISDRERLDGIRYGAAMELADRGITVGQFDRIVKEAQMKAPSLSLEDILKTALIFGVPAGTLWYVMDQSIRNGGRKTRKLQSELDYYNKVSNEMKNRFRNSPKKERYY
jgi:hypothetical protein